MTENDDQHDKWEKALLGESSPSNDDPIERKAHTVRQLILWESTQKEKNLLPPYQASQLYKQASRINKKRKWMKAGIGIAGVLSVVAMALIYFLMQSPTLEKNDKQVSINPNNFVQANTILNMPYMLEIPAGGFVMGCVAGLDDIKSTCSDKEKKPHEVTVKKFVISKYPTTIAQFKKFVEETNYLTTAETSKGCTVTGEVTGNKNDWEVSKKHNWKFPGFAQNDQHPVVCISWNDTQAYIEWLSKKTGVQHRLPTEEEWEYAVRANGNSMYYWGSTPDRSFANYRGIGGNDKWEYTSPVGELSGVHLHKGT